jgi:hypothetical protein
MRRVPIILALVAALLLPGEAGAARRAADVWATVNACDTKMRPNEIGIRGGMAGLARRSRMHMRFRVQFQNSEREWKTLKSSRLTDSGWVRVAVGKGGRHDAGWSFEFKPPQSGGAHVLRGAVSFEWRKDKRVLARSRAFTEAGHPGTVGAEPADYSAETCEIA